MNINELSNLDQRPWKSRLGVFDALGSPFPKPQLILKTSQLSNTDYEILDSQQLQEIIMRSFFHRRKMRNRSPEQMIVNTTLGLKSRGTLDANLRQMINMNTSRAKKMGNPSKQVFGNLTYKNVETLVKPSKLPSGFFPLRNGGGDLTNSAKLIRVFGQNDFPLRVGGH